MSGVTLFEKLALAQISSHLAPTDETHTGDIDRVTALGFAPKMGSLLVRLRGAQDYKSYNDARQLLAERLVQVAKRKNWGHDARMFRVADCALYHYLVGSICRTCEGRGLIPNSYDGPREDKAGEVCPSCGGTGAAPRNARGRATAILQPGEILDRLEAIVDEADAILERSARLATGISRWKLFGRG